MSLSKIILNSIVLLILPLLAVAQPIPYPVGASDITTPFVHDPVMIRQDGTYYMFHTGPGVTRWESEDREHWTKLEPVFDPLPTWMEETVPGFSGHLWAPDIYFHEGTYYLYYSVSAFGENRSCIGVATNTTLHPDDPGYKWVDHGSIVESWPGVTNWNAIDPAVVEDDDGTAYLSFGSFWGGLMIARLSEDRLSLAEDWTTLTTIASRNPGPPTAPKEGYSEDPGSGAIEAPFIIRRGEFYWLFASIDYCCRGSASTYKMIVGRSKNVKGPYVDLEGIPMNEGGGTIILRGDDKWYGVGHNAVYNFEGQDYLIYHAYDKSDPDGKARLQIKAIDWGWPGILNPHE